MVDPGSTRPPLELNEDGGVSSLPLTTFVFVSTLVLSRGSVRDAILVTLGFRLLARLVTHHKLPAAASKELLKGVTVIGHRGCAVEAPENTLAAIRVAHANGVKAVEIDVEFSADGVPMIIHDSTLDRTTNGKGYVNSLTVAELKKLDASAHHPHHEAYKGETIPTLEEALRLGRELDMVVILDIKGESPFRVARALKALHDQQPGLFRKVTVCSFFAHTIYVVRWYLPEVVTGLTFRPRQLSSHDIAGLQPYFEGGWKAAVAPVVDAAFEQMLYYFFFPLCASSLHLLHEGAVSQHTDNYWRERGVTLLVWTVDDVDKKRVFRQAAHRPIPYMTDEVTREKNFL